MSADSEALPLTFTNSKTGVTYEIGTAKLVQTDKGTIIIATVGHNQFETLIDDPDTIRSLELSIKEKN